MDNILGSMINIWKVWLERRKLAMEAFEDGRGAYLVQIDGVKEKGRLERVWEIFRQMETNWWLEI